MNVFFTLAGSRGSERIVVMDKSKGEPVISVKTKSKDELVSPSRIVTKYG